MKKNNNLPILCLLVLLGLMTSLFACRKYFTTNPSTDLVASDLSGETGPQTILNGIYRLMRSSTSGSGGDDGGFPTLALATDMMGQDMAMANTGTFNAFYRHTAPSLSTGTQVLDTWVHLYRIIDNANQIINTQGVGSAQIAQALALRAYAYFFLANVYMNHEKDSITRTIPLYLQTTTIGGRLVNSQEAYQQIEQDLKDAIAAFGTANFVRTQKSQVDALVAHGILARVSIFRKKWAQALAEAKRALGGNPSFDGNDLMDSPTFRAGFNSVDNAEWIWGLPTNFVQSGFGFSSFFHMDPIIQGEAGGSRSFKEMSYRLWDAMLRTDVRKELILPKKDPKVPIALGGIRDSADFCQIKFRDPNSAYANALTFKADRVPGKVENAAWTGAFPLMRKAEMYLIAAEACANIGDMGMGKAALNALQKKRGAYMSNMCTKDSVYMERRRELWGEGFSLFDLKRLQKPVDRREDSVHMMLSSINANVLFISARSDSLNYKIPQRELQNNPFYGGRQPGN